MTKWITWTQTPLKQLIFTLFSIIIPLVLITGVLFYKPNTHLVKEAKKDSKKMSAMHPFNARSGEYKVVVMLIIEMKLLPDWIF